MLVAILTLSPAILSLASTLPAAALYPTNSHQLQFIRLRVYYSLTTRPGGEDKGAGAAATLVGSPPRR